jgi:hypothetical protein
MGHSDILFLAEAHNRSSDIRASIAAPTLFDRTLCSFGHETTPYNFDAPVNSIINFPQYTAGFGYRCGSKCRRVLEVFDRELKRYWHCKILRIIEARITILLEFL